MSDLISDLNEIINESACSRSRSNSHPHTPTRKSITFNEIPIIEEIPNEEKKREWPTTKPANTNNENRKLQTSRTFKKPPILPNFIESHNQLLNMSILEIYEHIQTLQQHISILNNDLSTRKNEISHLRGTAKTLSSRLSNYELRDISIIPKSNILSDEEKKEEIVREDIKEEEPPTDVSSSEDDDVTNQLTQFLEDEDFQPSNSFSGSKSTSYLDILSVSSENILTSENSSDSLDRWRTPYTPSEKQHSLQLGTEREYEHWELLPDLTISCVGYNTENGYLRMNDAPIDFMQYNRKFYEDFFIDKEHINLISKGSNKPIICSILKERFHYRVLVRNSIEDRHYLIEKTKLDKLKLSFKSFTQKLFKSISPKLAGIKWTTVGDDCLKDDLLTFESYMVHRQFKVGVLLANEGQRREEDMFCNESGSVAYEEFLDFLGDKVELNGWKGFSGGLDTKTGTTGKFSIFSSFQDYEIMFHVSTLLPFSKSDPQQVERKRHLGNDIVVILFLDSQTPYKPTLISSNFVHVVIVIQPLKNNKGFTTHYRMCCVTKDGVENFSPSIPKPPFFAKNNEYRSFLYNKIINAELACHRSEQFAKKLTNTREAYLIDMAQKYR